MRIFLIFVSLFLSFIPVCSQGSIKEWDKIARYILGAENDMSKGNYREALSKLEQISSMGNVPSGTKFDICLDKAICQKYLGNYTESYHEFDNAEKLAKEEDEVTNVRYNKACLLISMGKYEEADKLLLDITQDSYLMWKTTRRSEILYRQGYSDQALALIDNAMSKICIEDTSYPFLLQNHAYILQSIKGKELQAISEMKLLLNIIKPNTLNYQIVKGNLAKTEAIIGDYRNALTHIDESINWVSNNIDNSPLDYIILLRKKAEILLLMSDPDGALKIYHQYFVKQREYTLKTFSVLTEQNRLDYWKTLKPNMSKIFALEDNCPDFLLDVALFRREVAMLGDADKNEMTKRLNISGQKLRKSLNEHEIAIDFVRYTKNDTARYGAIIVPSLAMKSKIQFIPLWTEEELHGFILSNSQRLDSALCSNSMYDKDVLYTDSVLTKLVWDKLECELNKYDYEDVYFAPDGLLHLLAIEYLREDNGVCLHRMTSLAKLLQRNKHILSFKSKMLAAGGFDYDKEESERTADSVANHEAMDYLQSQIRHIDRPFSYLKGAKIEIDSISYCSPFDTDTTYVQTERQLKNAVKNRKYNILHLSTHGYALDVNVPNVPVAFCDSITEDQSLLATGIALTSANVAYKNEGSEDGIISAREFCEMDMSNIELVVLSACQTGLGRYSDEGPAGLVRGLKKAGAGSLIVSLWSVSDDATQYFMKHLYKAISEQSHPDIHAAFNAARINFSKESKQGHSFNSRKMKSVRYEYSYNQPRYCNSFILIDAIK